MQMAADTSAADTRYCHYFRYMLPFCRHVLRDADVMSALAASFRDYATLCLYAAI